MKLGIDWDGTMASYPNAFRRLVKFATEVHVITLNPYLELETVRIAMELDKDMSDVKVRKHVYPHEILGHDETLAPEWKSDKCNELGIDIFFDDREDICQMVEQTSCAAVIHVTERANIL